MIEEILLAMTEYYKGDARRVHHFMKVWAFASAIGKKEELDDHTQQILEIAAAVHDIGIKVSEEKYGSAAGHYQEIEGVPAARSLLAGFDLSKEIVERVCTLVGRHHTYTNIDGMDCQILIEADFLVNFQEGHVPMDRLGQVREKIFKTKTGTQMLDLLYG